MKIVQNFFIPFQIMDIEQHRAGSIRYIGHMDAPASQFPDEPCIDRSKQQLTPLCLLLRSRHMFQYPVYFGCRKIRVRNQACPLADQFSHPIGCQAVDPFCRPPALPDDRRIHWLSCLFIPHDRRLSLVRDPDTSNVCSRNTELTHGLCHDTELAGPDLYGIVFHPARFRITLAEFLLRNAAHAPRPIKKNAAGTRGSLIKRDHILIHSKILLP